MSLLERNRAAARVCFGTRPADEDLTALGAPDRWLLYRRLVRNRIREMLGNGLPRTAAALGEHFEEAFRRWLDEAPPRTRFIREIIPLFSAFARPLWLEAGASPWILDLADYETAAWEARYVQVREDLPVVDLDFERIAVLNPTVRLLKLGHPVTGWQPGEEPPEPGTTHVIVYRNLSTHRSSGWVMNETSEAIVRRLTTGDLPLSDAVRQAAEERGVDITPRFIESLGQMLADFIERTIVLGSRP